MVRRTWVQQEVSAARQMEMSCGSYGFNLRNLHDVVEYANPATATTVPQSFFILTSSKPLRISGRSVAMFCVSGDMTLSGGENKRVFSQVKSR